MINFKHYTVLLKESVQALNIKKDGVYIDGTVGGGGHSEMILKNLSPRGKLICIDKDPDALTYVKNKFASFDNVHVIKADFKNIPEVADSLNIEFIDGILLDVGVSSYQLDQIDRGFCYSKDADLDMRMSKEGQSAFDIINYYSVEDLAKIIREYGEEKCAWKIADNIQKFRNVSPIKRTSQLADIVKQSIPAPLRRKGGNPCNRTFQAIRIAVNGELDSLSECIDSSFERLNVGGRFCIITFHSLEDRIVKKKFVSLTQGCTCPPNFPVCVCGKKPKAKLIQKKPILPSESELAENSRSQSAKLRVIEKL